VLVSLAGLAANSLHDRNSDAMAGSGRDQDQAHELLEMLGEGDHILSHAATAMYCLKHRERWALVKELAERLTVVGVERSPSYLISISDRCPKITEEETFASRLLIDSRLMKVASNG
jgi:hypothetical protein